MKVFLAACIILISQVCTNTFLIKTNPEGSSQHYESEAGEEYSEDDEPSEDAEPSGYKEDNDSNNLNGWIYFIFWLYYIFRKMKNAPFIQVGLDYWGLNELMKKT